MRLKIFHVKSLERLAELHLQYPVLVRAEFISDAFERVATGYSELQHIVTEAIGISNHACIFSMPTTLGELLERLDEDTGMYSGSRERTHHPNVKKIVAFGDLATRYILTKMAAGEFHWEHFILLRELTGENPVLPEHRGYVAIMTLDWLRWAKTSGKLDPLALSLCEGSI